MSRLQGSVLPDLGILILKVWNSRQQGLPGLDIATTQSHLSPMPGCQEDGHLRQAGLSREERGSVTASLNSTTMYAAP